MKMRRGCVAGWTRLLLLAIATLLLLTPSAAATDPITPSAPTSADDAAKTTGVAENSASGSEAASSGTSGAAAAASSSSSSSSTATAAAAALSRRLDDEARQVKYVVGLLAAAPAKSKATSTGARTMVMTAKSGQKFRCTIPDPSDQGSLLPDVFATPADPLPEPTASAAAASVVPAAAPTSSDTSAVAPVTPDTAAAPAVAAPAVTAPATPAAAEPAATGVAAPTAPVVPESKLVPNLIRKQLGNGCFTKQVDYWTYEVCPFRRARQYHRQPDQSINMEFSLGTYVALGDAVGTTTAAAVAAAAAGGSAKMGAAAATVLNPVLYTQLYDGGTNNRQSLVRFLCNPDAAPAPNTMHLLTTVREPKPFHYEFEIVTTLMCRDAKGVVGGVAAAVVAAAKAEQTAALQKAAAATSAASGATGTVAAGVATDSLNGPIETGRLHTGARRRVQTASASSSSSGGASSPGAAPSSDAGADPPAPNVMDLLEPLGSECMYLNTGWWTYKYCYLKEITQFHREHVAVQLTPAVAAAAAKAAAAPPAVKLGAKTAAEAAANLLAASQAQQAAQALAGATATKLVTTAEFVLGRVAASATLDELEAGTRVVQGDSWDNTYVSQHYRSGTLCDLNAQPRTAETRIYCDPASAAPMADQSAIGSIKSVVEASTCHYVVVIHSHHICRHPLFKPKVPKVAEISCEPINADGSPMTQPLVKRVAHATVIIVP